MSYLSAERVMKKRKFITLFCFRIIFKFFLLQQGVLAAVFSTMFGSKDPEQANTLAKQAGEVSKRLF